MLLGTARLESGGGAWAGDVEDISNSVLRPGFLRPDGRGLQISKLENLRNDPFVADNVDGLVNYEEIANSLGHKDKRTATVFVFPSDR